jgi:hypothetical protein
MLAVVVADVEGEGEYQFERRQLGTTPDHLRLLSEWFVEQEVEEAVMESTAQYWKPVWGALEGYWKPTCQKREGAGPMSGALHLAQAQSNRGPQGRKKDFPDAERLVKRFVAQELSLSFVPDTEQRLWRTVMRRKYQLTCDRVQLQNRLESLLEDLEQQIVKLEQEMAGLLIQHQEAVQRLAEVPGLGVASAQQIIAEVGAQAATFASQKHLSCWVGACPGDDESAGVSTSHRSPKGNRQMRRILNQYQCANAAVRTKGSIFEIVYRRLVLRLGHNQTIGAIANRLCRLIWIILHRGVRYEERGQVVSGRVRKVEANTHRAYDPAASKPRLSRRIADCSNQPGMRPGAGGGIFDPTRDQGPMLGRANHQSLTRTSSTHSRLVSLMGDDRVWEFR